MGAPSVRAIHAFTARSTRLPAEPTAQFPIALERVVYSASGSRLAAARLTGDEIVEHKLYWAPVSSADEGRYLCAILNSHVLGERVAPLQSVGQFGPRDFDKYVFAIPFPTFDPADELHAEIALAASEAEQVAAAVALPEGCGFQKARRLVRAALDESGVGGNGRAADRPSARLDANDLVPVRPWLCD